MIDGLKVLAVIPARGGSKGAPRKNLRMLGGKPLIAWTIDAARQSRAVDRVIVSTDDHEIAEAALKWGGEVPFMRPTELAQDDTPGDAPFRHAAGETPGFDIAVLLQPTSPLRNAADIDGCVALALETEGSVVSVTESGKHPAWMFTLDGCSMSPVSPHLAATSRRQALPTVYVLNGAVYVMKTADLASGQALISSDTAAYVMPADRSIDIDTEIDFIVASAYIDGRQI